MWNVSDKFYKENQNWFLSYFFPSKRKIKTHFWVTTFPPKKIKTHFWVTSFPPKRKPKHIFELLLSHQKENQNSFLGYFFPPKGKSKLIFELLLSLQNSCRLWDNGGRYGRARYATDGNIIRRMRCKFRKTKGTDTHPEYVILISIPLQLWLRERASVHQSRPVRKADNLTTFMCRLSWNLGASTSWNPQGLSRSVMGLLLLYTYIYIIPIFLIFN